MNTPVFSSTDFLYQETTFLYIIWNDINLFEHQIKRLMLKLILLQSKLFVYRKSYELITTQIIFHLLTSSQLEIFNTIEWGYKICCNKMKCLTFLTTHTDALCHRMKCYWNAFVSVRAVLRYSKWWMQAKCLTKQIDSLDSEYSSAKHLCLW